MTSAEQLIRQKFVEWYRPTAQGVITAPGKFEGQMLYVPYYWGMLDEGRWDGGITHFDVTRVDRLIFPELEGEECVSLVENDVGFVCECAMNMGEDDGQAKPD